MHDEALKIAAALCRRFEGTYLRPYICPAGVVTLGIGCTRYVDGRPVRLTDPPITVQEAEIMLMVQLRTQYLPGVLTACPRVDTPGRLGALVDFAYNLGVGALRASTLRRKVNEGDWDAVPGELRKW